MSTSKRIPKRAKGNTATTISISKVAHAAGKALAKAERRSFSGQIEMLILADARRRGLIKDDTRQTAQAPQLERASA